MSEDRRSPPLRLPLVAGIDERELADRVGRYPWYHRIGLGERIVTPGVERYVSYQRPVLELLAEQPVAGRALDVGCRDGIFAFAAEQAGAAEIVAIDNNLSRGATELLIPTSGSRVRMRQMNLLEATPELLGGRFDLVVLAGVLYHLRYPFWALRLLSRLLTEGGTLLVETAVVVDSGRWATLWCPTGQDGPYDATSPSFFNRRALLETLTSFGLEVERFELLGEGVRHPRRWRQRLGRRGKRVDRATLLCRLRSELVDPDLVRYWDSTHGTSLWS